MKMIKYFALVLVMFGGQAIADPYYGNLYQIRSDAQRLINAERSLLATINRSGAGHSRPARDLRVLVNNTLRLKRSAFYRSNSYVMRSQMRRIRSQFRHMRMSIARSHRLNRSRLVRFKVRRIARNMGRLSRDVFAYRGVRVRRVVHW